MGEIEPRRIKHVTILLSRETDTVTLPWASRQALLERLRGREGAEDVIRRFEAVGTTRPVRLDVAGKRLILNELYEWEIEVKTIDALPEGLWDLRCALIDDRDAGFWNADHETAS
jgi:hypothetical protein